MVDILRGPVDLLGIRVEGSITAANGEVAIFSVAGGFIKINSLVGIVTTEIGGTVSAAKIVANPTATGSTSDLCGASNVEGDIVGTLYSVRLGTTSQALRVAEGGVLGSEGTAYIITGAIAMNFSADPTAGVIRWVLHYLPVDLGASVVAA